MTKLIDLTSCPIVWTVSCFFINSTLAVDVAKEQPHLNPGIVKGISVSDLYYSAKIPSSLTTATRDKDGMPGDKDSHGTHVASTAAGNTGASTMPPWAWLPRPRSST